MMVTFTSLRPCTAVREGCTGCQWPEGGSVKRSPSHSLSPGHCSQAPGPGAADCWPVPQEKAPNGRFALGVSLGLVEPLRQGLGGCQKS